MRQTGTPGRRAGLDGQPSERGRLLRRVPGGADGPHPAQQLRLAWDGGASAVCSPMFGHARAPLRAAAPPCVGPAVAAPARLAAVAVRSFLAPWLGLSARGSPVARGRVPLPPPSAAAAGPSPAGPFCGPPGSGRARGPAAPLGCSGLPGRSPCAAAAGLPGPRLALAGPSPSAPCGRRSRPRSSRPGAAAGCARLVAALPPPGVGGFAARMGAYCVIVGPFWAALLRFLQPGA